MGADFSVQLDVNVAAGAAVDALFSLSDLDQRPRPVYQYARDGSFTVPGLPEGEYRLRLHTPEGDTGQRVRRISFQEESPINVVGVNVFGTMFDDLIQLSTDLKAGATGVTITGHLGAIDAAIEQVIGGRAELGARTNRFEAALAQSESTNITLQELKRDIEEVDLAEAITKMTSQQTALEAAIGAIGTTSRMSLLNFLQ